MGQLRRARPAVTPPWRPEGRKTIRVSEEFHELLKAHNREGETMEETLRRVMSGPDPSVLSDVIGTDEEVAVGVRTAIRKRRERGRDRRATHRERTE